MVKEKFAKRHWASAIEWVIQVYSMLDWRQRWCEMSRFCRTSSRNFERSLIFQIIIKFFIVKLVLCIYEIENNFGISETKTERTVEQNHL